MTRVEQSIEVNVPVRIAYNQWTQFEEFPQFMEGVESIRQIDDKHMHWKAKIAGKTEEWDATVTEQIPDKRVAWKSTSGNDNAGVVTFHFIGENTTRIMVQMDFQPEGIIENVGAALGAADRRVQGDLKRFKEFIEKRGDETGAWRGEIRNEKAEDSPGTE